MDLFAATREINEGRGIVVAQTLSLLRRELRSADLTVRCQARGAHALVVKEVFIEELHDGVRATQ
jgi:hypothetical protein